LTCQQQSTYKLPSKQEQQLLQVMHKLLQGLWWPKLQLVVMQRLLQQTPEVTLHLVRRQSPLPRRDHLQVKGSGSKLDGSSCCSEGGAISYDIAAVKAATGTSKASFLDVTGTNPSAY